MSQLSIGVLGAGAWGTALAIHLAKLHPTVNLWGRNSEALHAIINNKENARYLPGVAIPDNIVAVENVVSKFAASTIEFLIVVTGIIGIPIILIVVIVGISVVPIVVSVTTISSTTIVLVAVVSVVDVVVAS